MPIIKIKHSETGELRRLSLAEWPSVEALDRNLRVMFRDSLPAQYCLRYSDADGDTISIYSNLDFQEAQRTVPAGGALLLTLCPTTSGDSISYNRLPPLRSSLLSSFGGFGFPSSPTGPPPSSSSSSSSSPASPASLLRASLQQSFDAATVPQLRVVDWAPADFIAGLEFLINAGYDSEKSRDVLIDFGGIADEANKAISSSPSAFLPAPNAPSLQSINFSPAFIKSVLALESSGFDRKVVVATLIRNGGVSNNAALELAGTKNEHRCANGHDMAISSYNMGNYATGWFCDRCKKRGAPGQRWKCSSTCEYDVCFDCLPAPPSPPPTLVEPPLVSDNSLPPVLLIPVRQLEAMGFTDRMRVIELIVQNGGDITQTAFQLAEERRQLEAREDAQKAAEAAAREAEAQRIRAEAEARRRAEEEKSYEENRRKAAELAAAHPEKIGADISYLGALGFDPISSMTSLFNNAGNLEQTIEELLRRQAEL